MLSWVKWLPFSPLAFNDGKPNWVTSWYRMISRGIYTTGFQVYFEQQDLNGITLPKSFISFLRFVSLELLSDFIYKGIKYILKDMIF